MTSTNADFLPPELPSFAQKPKHQTFHDITDGVPRIKDKAHALAVLKAQFEIDGGTTYIMLVISDAVKMIASEDIDALIMYVNELPDSPMRRYAVSKAVEELARVDLEAAYASANLEPDESQRSYLYRRILNIHLAGLSKQETLDLVRLELLFYFTRRRAPDSIPRLLPQPESSPGELAAAQAGIRRKELEMQRKLEK